MQTKKQHIKDKSPDGTREEASSTKVDTKANQDMGQIDSSYKANQQAHHNDFQSKTQINEGQKDSRQTELPNDRQKHVSSETSSAFSNPSSQTNLQTQNPTQAQNPQRAQAPSGSFAFLRRYIEQLERNMEQYRENWGKQSHLPKFFSKAFQNKQNAQDGDKADENEGSKNNEGANDGSILGMSDTDWQLQLDQWCNESDGSLSFNGNQKRPPLRFYNLQYWKSLLNSFKESNESKDKLQKVSQGTPEKGDPWNPDLVLGDYQGYDVMRSVSCQSYENGGGAGQRFLSSEGPLGFENHNEFLLCFHQQNQQMTSPQKQGEDASNMTTDRVEGNYKNVFDLENFDSLGDGSNSSTTTDRKKVGMNRQDQFLHELSTQDQTSIGARPGPQFQGSNDQNAEQDENIQMQNMIQRKLYDFWQWLNQMRHIQFLKRMQEEQNKNDNFQRVEAHDGDNGSDDEQIQSRTQVQPNALENVLQFPIIEREKVALRPEQIERKPICNKIHMGSFEEYPDELKDNEYILSGYRCGCHGPGQAAKSLFMWHNETVNVWSHLLGAIVFFILIINFLGQYKDMYYDGSQALDEFKQISQQQGLSLTQFINTKFDNLNIREMGESQQQTTPGYKMHQVEGISYLVVEQARQLSKDLTPQNSQTITSYTKEAINEISVFKDYLLSSDWQSKGTFKQKIQRLSIIQKGLEQLQKFKQDFEAKINIFTTANPKFELASAINPESVLTYVPRWPLVVHLISAVFCLGASALYHLLCCYSCEVNAHLARLDYSGICFLILGSSYSGIYYGFACQGVGWIRTLWMIYMTTSCSATMILFLVPMFAQSKYRAFRGWLFVIVGFSTGMWILWLWTSSDKVNILQNDNKPWLWGGLSYGGGAMFFVYRFPERVFPKRFDNFGASHQIFHVCVVIGAIIHFNTAMNMFLLRHQHVCPMVLPSTD